MLQRVFSWRSFVEKFADVSRVGRMLPCSSSLRSTDPTFSPRSGPSHRRWCYAPCAQAGLRRRRAPVLKPTHPPTRPPPASWREPPRVRRRGLVFLPGNRPLQPVRAKAQQQWLETHVDAHVCPLPCASRKAYKWLLLKVKRRTSWIMPSSLFIPVSYSLWKVRYNIMAQGKTPHNIRSICIQNKRIETNEIK